jgi:diguanylate cyclase (GGDEF)-like protein
VVTVGQLDLPPESNRELLRASERLITQFWCRLSDVCQSRVAALRDPVTNLLTREAFLRVAQQSLRESYDQGEPVAVGIIALEGLRALNDSGRWEVADELVREVSGELRRKVRVDDRVVRYDGSRFALLLRRVDSELASLIVSQLVSRLHKVCSNEQRWRGRLEVRCGVVGSGMDNPDLRSLISRAVAQCRQARIENTQAAYDLGPIPALKVGDAT